MDSGVVGDIGITLEKSARMPAESTTGRKAVWAFILRSGECSQRALTMR